MEKVRAFIAIEIPDEIQHQITEVQTGFKPLASGVSWVKSQNIHLTLKFLGDIPVHQVAAVAECVTEACTVIQPFEILIQGTGFFPNSRRPRVVWIGCRYPEALKKLHSGIDQNLAELGFEKETRKFSPHLTIARVKSIKNIDALIKAVRETDFTGGEFRVNEVVVMKSQLHPAGSIYTPLAQIAL